MVWEQLLSLKRFGDTHKRLRAEQDETRLGFDVDYDRIIFSAEFRSLQDKTQVIPLSKTDFVHTRLTHSLEVSVVARSLGRIVGKHLLQKHPALSKIHGYKINDFGAILAAAAVAHDIGNPPFGHSGEKAIGAYFKTGNGARFKTNLTPQEYQDLCAFEGNANGFKILTQERANILGGLRLSYATLGAFIKYPKESLPTKPTNHIAHKKFGVFQSELNAFKDLTNELGLTKISDSYISYARHPLAFLVEAADDICYTIIDFEDGINLGLIPEDYALEYLINLVKDTLKKEVYNKLKTTKDRINYLRALAINSLIIDVAAIFMEYEEAILANKFTASLLDKSKYKAQINDIINLCIERVYQSKEVIEKEIAGYRLLNTLLNVYVTAVENSYNETETTYDKLILKLEPAIHTTSSSLYSRLLHVAHYVASLSDSQAILKHKTIKGLNF